MNQEKTELGTHIWAAYRLLGVIKRFQNMRKGIPEAVVEVALRGSPRKDG